MSDIPFMKDGRFLVSKLHVSPNLQSSIERAIDLIGGIESVIKPGDTVTIKPNLNTGDPYPASSDPHFIHALGKILLGAGVEKLRIADSSTIKVHSRDVAQRISLDEVADHLGAEMIYLEDHDWIKMKFPKARYMKNGHLGAPILDPGKIVLVPCLKTHRLARFTASMKLLVGWLRKRDRMLMHARKMEAKVVDLASYFRPSLIVMDARTIFTTGGPMSGTIENPGFVLASSDMVSIDVEGVRILQSYEAKNRLDMDVWDIPQIRHAVNIGIGAKSDDDILVIEPQ